MYDNIKMTETFENALIKDKVKFKDLINFENKMETVEILKFSIKPNEINKNERIQLHINYLDQSCRIYLFSYSATEFLKCNFKIDYSKNEMILSDSFMKNFRLQRIIEPGHVLYSGSYLRITVNKL